MTGDEYLRVVAGDVAQLETERDFSSHIDLTNGIFITGIATLCRTIAYGVYLLNDRRTTNPKP